MQRGVTRGNIVGLMVERSVEMVIGLYGILKAGGAYLPLAPDYPADRLRYMLEDSLTRWMVARKQHIASTQFTRSGIDIEDEFLYSHQCSFNPGPGSGPGDLIYVIYTSGSTGNPKGVPIKTRGFVSLVWWYVKELKLDAADKFLLIAPISFDLTQKNLFAPLITGGGLYLPPPGPIDYEAVSALAAREKQTVINCAPSVFYPFVEFNSNDGFERLKTLRYIILGGEPIQLDKLLPWLNSGTCQCEIFNTYGPTECTDVVSFYRLGMDKLDGSAVIPIGRPVDNVMLVILDRAQKLLSIGIVGEVCIGGIGLGPGYCNNMELTVEKFIQAPPWCLRGERLYRTGDLGRWLPGGDIEFLGRLDHQVKIRGLRIELEEIESHLLTHGSIKEAVVYVQEDSKNNKYLCAYIVSNGKLTPSVLRDFLSPRLPAYMIPSYFVMLEHVPLTPSGKIDRKALPEPDLDVSLADYAPPRDRIEKKLVEIWLEVLEIENRTIGINDNFFELGGHSLKATILVSKIHKELKVNVPLPEVFKKPHIRGLASFIKKAGTQRFFSIEAVEKKEYYQLSSAQKRLHFLQQMEPESKSYNMQTVMILQGELDRRKFEKVFKKSIERHESLRTSFEMISEVTVQRIHKDVEFEIKYFDLTPRYNHDPGNKIHPLSFIIDQFVRPFDLSTAPLLHVGLVKEENTKHYLMVDMHHIIADGTSIGILQKEFMALYRGIDLPPLRIHYKEYAGWQTCQNNRESLNTQEKFWLLQFEEETPVLSLPTDYTRPLMQSFEGDILYFELSEEENLSLKTLTRKQDVTLYMVLLAICNTWLSKLSGDEDIVIGTPVAGRKHDDFQGIIGMFVNTLALRNYPVPEKTFSDFLKEVKARTLEAFQNQDYQFEDLVDLVVSNRDTSRNPVFDVMFMFQNMETPGIEIPELILKPYQYENKTSKFDLILSGMEKEGKLIFTLEYSTKLFKKETARRFIAYFKNIINFFLENPAARISTVEIMSKEEKERILEISNGLTVSVDTGETIHGMFEKIVIGNEDKTALVFRDSRITYGELNQRANRLAYVLRSRGIRKDSLVGLMIERSFRLVISILGILKAGGAYLPIDSNYPGTRKKYMLMDSKLSLLLTNYDIEDLSDFISNNLDVILLKNEGIYKGEEENPRYNADGSNLLYLIYTSGSTGEPKGIMLEHRSLVNLIDYQFNHTNISFNRVLQFTTISFDVSFQEIFSTLLAGGKLYLVDEETRNNIPGLFEVINRNEIETLFLPASFLKFVMNEKEYIHRMPTGVCHIVTAGEQVIVGNRFRNYLKENRVWLHNHYGPAETHVVTMSTLDPNGEIPELPSIGKPVSNTGIFILDKGGHLQPIGIPGELFIEGIQVGRGYFGRDDLTRERFISSPFTPGKPFYRTGDLAKWLPDGNLEFLGRIDSQVKIRGFRVELGEIESQLLTYSEIKEAVVIAGEENRGIERYLCGYFVADRHIPPGGLREYLSIVLPDYMVPSYFVQVEKIPITPNGKIDRKALPAPEIKKSDNYEAPRNRIEKKLVDIWSGVLGTEKEKIGINDDFFHLGGHSLKATLLVSRIHKELKVKVPLAEIFKTSHIRGLAAFIKNAEAQRFFSIEAVEKKEYYILSSAQRRLLVLQQMDEKGIAYNMPSIWQLEGYLDAEKFKAVFQHLIQRHESLRTSFYMVNDEPVQRIGGKSLIGHWSPVIGKAGKNEIEDLSKNFIKPFDLSRAPLFRVGLLEQEEQKNILMIDMHHIISDGMSVGIFVNEFMELYAGKILPVLKLQYKDYAEWHNRQIPAESLKLQETHWSKEFEGDIPVLDLPTDYSRPLTQSFEGNTIQFKMDKEETGVLKSLAHEQGVTLFMLLLSLYTAFLSKLSSQEEIVVGTPIAGRRHADLENLMGMFVNTLALRNFPLAPMTFTQFLTGVKENTLKAFENQDYLYEDLVEKVEIERDIGRNPLFDTMFVLQNIDVCLAEYRCPGN
jgi:amino acid adenylation domain-containing protein